MWHLLLHKKILKYSKSLKFIMCSKNIGLYDALFNLYIYICMYIYIIYYVQFVKLLHKYSRKSTWMINNIIIFYL